MTESEILEYLAKKGAVLTDGHFVYTSGMHGTAYINMRTVGHDARWLSQVGHRLSQAIEPYGFNLIIGPETLGRNLASFTAYRRGEGEAIWCDIVEEGGQKRAVFSPKLDFSRLVSGKKVAIVDDLLTTGGSIKLVADLVAETGGEVVVAAVVVRRTPEVAAATCGVPALEVLADVTGFRVFTEEQCASEGPCSKRIPVVLRPGHGWKWIDTHPGYPTSVV